MEIKRDSSRVRLDCRVNEKTGARLKLMAKALGLIVRHKKREIGAVGLLMDAIAGLDDDQTDRLIDLLKENL